MGSDTHADAAHDYASDTFAFYFDQHGRDSIDGVGMDIVSTVHYDSGYANAFWSSSYQQMVYGDAYGFPLGDDVVGHELTHGVTEYESNLFYYYQSGAINESFSDLWGEFVDLTNGDGDDSAGARWLMGEDVSGMGAIRDMENPPAYNDPDKMTSSYYYTGSADLGWFGDNGGVHTNSGVNNKAVFLLTDGGSFNGYDVAGLGIEKVAAIYYEVQTSLLTSGADYGDLYNALYQGCLNLVGGAEGITVADCTEVQDATNAVEMNLEPVLGYNPEADLCPVGGTPMDMFYDDFEGGDGNWAFGAISGISSWGLASGYTTSGTNLVWGNDYYTSSDSYAAMDLDVSLPASMQPYLHFNHAFGFEDPDYDGGWLEYSINGGGAWNDARPLFEDGLDYTGTINTTYGDGDNIHTGRDAYVGDSHGYVSNRYNLNSLTGENIRFRWRMSTDSIYYDFGWVLDDVRIYTCRPEQSVPADFDGDGDTDISIYHWHATYGQQWYIKDQGTWSWGAETSIPVPADYDGDGDTDIAVYDNGTWYIKDIGVYGWGGPDSVPVPGDYDGDGDADIAVIDFHPIYGLLWYIKDQPTHSWGNAASLPVQADYNGDGLTDVAVYNDGMWYIEGVGVFSWGNAASIPVPGDYDGDGDADLAVYVVESGTGTWYIQGGPTAWWGGVGSIPVPGDYNGDGVTDIAIYHLGTWYVWDVLTDTWGGPGDYPLPAPDYDGDGEPY
jgi:hypothetical protein